MRKAILPFLALVIALALTGRAACSNKDLIPFMGKWAGGFVVDRVKQGPDTDKDRKRSGLNGYLQIYGTQRSFKLHLEGEQQTLDIAGTWIAKGNKVTLTTTDFQMDDQGGADLRNPNQKFVPAEDLNRGYSHPVVLTLSADKKRLTGLPTSIGDLVGRHEFVKDSP